MRFVRLLAIMFVLCSLLVPAAAYAAKKYQVTGTVIEIGDKVIVVEKKDAGNANEVSFARASWMLPAA